jgi:hypothetical protein
VSRTCCTKLGQGKGDGGVSPHRSKGNRVQVHNNDSNSLRGPAASSTSVRG